MCVMGFCFMFLWWNPSIRLFLHGVKWGSENSTHEIRVSLRSRDKHICEIVYRTHKFPPHNRIY